MGLRLHSMPILEFKPANIVLLMQVLDVAHVALKLAAHLSIDDIVLVSNVGLSFKVLNWDGCMFCVERIYLQVFDQVPHDEHMLCLRLSYSDNYSIWVTAASYEMDIGLRVIFGDINIQPGDYLGVYV
jgi:hypothetical protein